MEPTLKERELTYHHDGVELQGLLVAPESADESLPGILIAHAWGGRGDFEAAVARRLAAEGYAAFALDMYGTGVRGGSREENAALIQPFLQDRAMLQARMHAALVALRAQPEVQADRMAAVGYCFGGLCVLDLARSGADICGVISVHGLFKPPEPLPEGPIRAAVLALHGHDDPMVPVAAVNALEQELTQAGADWQIHVYGGAMHAFTNPVANDPDFGTVYHAAADRRSWTSMLNFLSERLS